jgi:flagellin
VNGQTASADGLQVYFSSSNTSIRFSIEEAYNAAPGSTSFTISGDGANWQLGANYNDKIFYGMSSLTPSNLGNDTIGYLTSLKSGGANDLSSGNYQTAYNIASHAANMVSTERSRLGAISTYTVDTAISVYQNTKSNLQSARSSIIDLDYASETANNTRLQILTQATTSILAGINSNTTSILSLLNM